MSGQHTIVNRGLAWVGGASSFVAVLDIVALILILKFWVGLEDFGTATTVLAFHGTFELFAEMGITAAIIQKTVQSPRQLSTLYWLNIFFALSVCALIYLAAPFFASLHHHEIIASLFRLYALHIVIRSLYLCQQALMKRELRFKELSVIRLCSNLADFIVRVGSAAHGAGAWCFIFGLLARTFVEGLGVILRSRWRPHLTFNLLEVRSHLRFGIKSSLAEMIYRTYSNCDYWVVSFFFGLDALGLYRAAYELVLEPIRFLSLIVTNVAFPVFSRLKDDLSEVTAQFITLIRQNCIVIALFISLILVCSDELLILFFRPDYVAAAEAARILALVGGLRAMSHLGPPLLDALGRPDLTLRYQGFSAIILIVFFILFAWLFGGRCGFNAVALAWAAGYPVGFCYLITLLVGILGCSLWALFEKLWPIFVCGAVSSMIGGVVRFSVLDGVPAIRLVVGIITTVAIFLLALGQLTGITPRSIFKALHCARRR